MFNYGYNYNRVMRKQLASLCKINFRERRIVGRHKCLKSCLSESVKEDISRFYLLG